MWPSESDSSDHINMTNCLIWMQLLPVVISKHVPLLNTKILFVCFCSECISLSLSFSASACGADKCDSLHFIFYVLARNIICDVLIGWCCSGDWQPGRQSRYTQSVLSISVVDNATGCLKQGSPFPAADASSTCACFWYSQHCFCLFVYLFVCFCFVSSPKTRCSIQLLL